MKALYDRDKGKPVRQDMDNWQPIEFIRETSQQSLQVFLATNENCPFLLVLLDGPNSELAKGLQALELSRAEPDTLVFNTSLQHVDFAKTAEVYATAAEQIAERKRMGKLDGKSLDRIPDSLLRVPCHVVPIRKRSEGSFLQNVSIGRARNNDIVLRHAGVSKFHASIEVQDGPRLIVRDSESRNHTYIDGQLVVNRVEVLPGQMIRFGSVDARICSGEVIWNALQA